MRFVPFLVLKVGRETRGFYFDFPGPTRVSGSARPICSDVNLRAREVLLGDGDERFARFAESETMKNK
jgi:hypothetical protein